MIAVVMAVATLIAAMAAIVAMPVVTVPVVMTIPYKCLIVAATIICISCPYRIMMIPGMRLVHYYLIAMVNIVIAVSGR